MTVAYLKWVMWLHSKLMGFDSWLSLRAAGWYDHSRRQKLWAHTQLGKMKQ